MAITPDEAAAGKIEEMLKKAEDIELYIDAHLVKNYYPGTTVSLESAGFPHSLDAKLSKLIRDKYIDAGWQIKTSTHMNEEYWTFSPLRKRPPGTMRC